MVEDEALDRDRGAIVVDVWHDEPRAPLQVVARVSHRDRESTRAEERRVVGTVPKSHDLVTAQAKRRDEGRCRPPLIDTKIGHVDVIELGVPGRCSSPTEPKPQTQTLEFVQSSATGRGAVADDLRLDDVSILGGESKAPQIGYCGRDADQMSVFDRLGVEAIDVVALGAIDFEADSVRTRGVDQGYRGGDAHPMPKEHRPIGGEDQSAIEANHRPAHAEVLPDQVDRVERSPRTQRHLDTMACGGPDGAPHALRRDRPAAADQRPIDIDRDEPNRRERTEYRHREIVADLRRVTARNCDR